jgi:putative PIN family toxin of toxin-antitoxin system
MLAVLDTNVIVSALWSKNGQAAKVMAMALNGLITACYDQRILSEYSNVLKRPKFHFAEWEVNDLLAQIEHHGHSVVAPPLPVAFTDEDDLKFYEVAKHCQATLVTGNLRHFPEEPLIVSVADFLKGCLS